MNVLFIGFGSIAQKTYGKCNVLNIEPSIVTIYALQIKKRCTF